MKLSRDEVVNVLVEHFNQHDPEHCRCQLCRKGNDRWALLAYDLYERASSDHSAKMYWWVVYLYRLDRYFKEPSNASV